MGKTRLSLKSRALQLLAQREQSRSELRRKLLAHAKKEAREAAIASAAAAAAVASATTAGGAPASSRASALASAPTPATYFPADADAGEGNHADRDDPKARVDALLLWLEANRFASDARFAESRVNARAPRFGHLRIAMELKQHGVALSAESAQALRDTEWPRAVEVWRRRFGAPAESPADTAKQARFLTARGFSTEIVRRVLRSAREHVGPHEVT